MLEIKGTYGPSYQMHDPGDGVIGSALKTGEPYEAKLLYHIYRRKFQGLAVDAGAHVGNHTVWFAVACDLEVMAFEPVEHQKLLANVAANASIQDSVRTWPQALGSRFGWAEPAGDGVLHPCEPGDEGAVPVVPLDSFELRELAMLKIDVEGMEPEVLAGGEQTINRCRPTIYAEARDKPARARNASVLQRMDYKPTGLVFGATPMEEWEPC